MGVRYRILRSFFIETSHWNTYDPFLDQKTDAFKHSGTSIHRKSRLLSYKEVELLLTFT